MGIMNHMLSGNSKIMCHNNQQNTYIYLFIHLFIHIVPVYHVRDSSDYDYFAYSQIISVDLSNYSIQVGNNDRKGQRERIFLEHTFVANAMFNPKRDNIHKD